MQRQADYLTEYAEWLISSGQNDGETAEDVLLSAADALLEFDVGEGGPSCGLQGVTRWSAGILWWCARHVRAYSGGVQGMGLWSVV